jgi:hypothetical protein
MNTDRLAGHTGGPIAFDDRESEGGVERVEKGVANGWLKVRVRGPKWASARDFSRDDFDRGIKAGSSTLRHPPNRNSRATPIPWRTACIQGRL